VEKLFKVLIIGRVVLLPLLKVSDQILQIQLDYLPATAGAAGLATAARRPTRPSRTLGSLDRSQKVEEN
jgi:hypothetical protein